MSVKKAVIILIIVAVIGIVVVIGFVGNKESQEYSTAVVSQGKIIQTVSETGTLKAADEINMSFLNSGRIAKINHRIGDIVPLGTIIAELDYTDLEIKRDELKANVDVKKESLNKLLAGATTHEINVSKASVGVIE